MEVRLDAVAPVVGQVDPVGLPDAGMGFGNVIESSTSHRL